MDEEEFEREFEIQREVEQESLEREIEPPLNFDADVERAETYSSPAGDDATSMVSVARSRGRRPRDARQDTDATTSHKAQRVGQAEGVVKDTGDKIKKTWTPASGMARPDSVLPQRASHLMPAASEMFHGTLLRAKRLLSRRCVNGLTYRLPLRNHNQLTRRRATNTLAEREPITNYAGAGQLEQTFREHDEEWERQGSDDDNELDDGLTQYWTREIYRSLLSESFAGQSRNNVERVRTFAKIGLHQYKCSTPRTFLVNEITRMEAHIPHLVAMHEPHEVGNMSLADKDQETTECVDGTVYLPDGLAFRSDPDAVAETSITIDAKTTILKTKDPVTGTESDYAEEEMAFSHMYYTLTVTKDTASLVIDDEHAEEESDWETHTIEWTPSQKMVYQVLATDTWDRQALLASVDWSSKMSFLPNPENPMDEERRQVMLDRIDGIDLGETLEVKERQATAIRRAQVDVPNVALLACSLIDTDVAYAEILSMRAGQRLRVVTDESSKARDSMVFFYCRPTDNVWAKDPANNYYNQLLKTALLSAANLSKDSVQAVALLLEVERAQLVPKSRWLQLGKSVFNRVKDHETYALFEQHGLSNLSWRYRERLAQFALQRLHPYTSSFRPKTDKTTTARLVRMVHGELELPQTDIVAFSDGRCYDPKIGRARTTLPRDRVSGTTGYPLPSLDARKWARLEELLLEIYPEPGVLEWRLGLMARGLSGQQAVPTIVVCKGEAGAGKGLMCNLQSKAWGPLYGVVQDKKLVEKDTKSNASTASPAVLALMHKRFVALNEVSSFDSDTLKNFLGGNDLCARDLFSKLQFFTPQFPSFEMSMNDAEVEADRQRFKLDKGVKRRLRVCRHETIFKNVDDKEEAEQLLEKWRRDPADKPAKHAFPVYEAKVNELNSLAPTLMAKLMDIYTKCQFEKHPWPVEPDSVTAATDKFLNSVQQAASPGDTVLDTFLQNTFDRCKCTFGAASTSFNQFLKSTRDLRTESHLSCNHITSMKFIYDEMKTCVPIGQDRSVYQLIVAESAGRRAAENTVRNALSSARAFGELELAVEQHADKSYFVRGLLRKPKNVEQQAHEAATAMDEEEDAFVRSVQFT